MYLFLPPFLLFVNVLYVLVQEQHIFRFKNKLQIYLIWSSSLLFSIHLYSPRSFTPFDITYHY